MDLTANDPAKTDQKKHTEKLGKISGINAINYNKKTNLSERAACHIAEDKTERNVKVFFL